jgi:hypothetical protein
MPPPMRHGYAKITFFVAIASFSACEEEAIVRPPPPPSLNLEELKTPTRAASQPSDESTLSVSGATGVTANATRPVAGGKKTTTMEAFMEDDIEPEMRKVMKSKTRSALLDSMLQQAAALQPDDPRFESSPQKSWQGIVDTALESDPPKYGQSCKQCHTLWRKPYKKSFRERTIEVQVGVKP